MLHRVPLVLAAAVLINNLLGQNLVRAEDAAARITGSIAYRERMALPADADIDVSLQDVSAADASAQTVAQISLPANGRQVPIPFELVYDPQKIMIDHRYSVRATIRMEGMLVYTTAQAYPVITNGAPHRVNLILQRVGHGHVAAKPPNPAVAEPAQDLQQKQEMALRAPEESSPQVTIPPAADESSDGVSGASSTQISPAQSRQPQEPAPSPATSQSRIEQQPGSDSPVANAPDANPAPPAQSSTSESPATLPDAPSARRDPEKAEPPAAHVSSLVNTQWKLYELDGKNIFFAPSERAITLAFSPEGERIAGSAGCNGYVGTFTDEAGEFRLRPAGTTMMACADNVMQREQAFLKMLRAVDGYELDGAVLSLTSNGKVMAKLRNTEDAGSQ